MSPPASWAASEASSSSVVATVRSRRDRASTSSPRSSSVLSGPAPLPFALVLMTASPTCDDVEPITARRHAVGSRFGEEHQECQDGSTAFQPLGLARRRGIWGAAVQHGAPTPHRPSLVLPTHDGTDIAVTFIGVARAVCARGKAEGACLLYGAVSSARASEAAIRASCR